LRAEFLLGEGTDDSGAVVEDTVLVVDEHKADRGDAGVFVGKELRI
jgi:hypothetical protein